MLADYLKLFLAYLQSLPYGDDTVHVAASCTRVLVVLFAVAVAVVVRGWFNYLLASAEERRTLHDGNVAYMVNQLLVVIAFAIAIGATLVNTTGLHDFIAKIEVAIAVQVIGMLVLRLWLRRVHHLMMRGNQLAGIRLGTIGLAIGIVTAFEMMR